MPNLLYSVLVVSQSPLQPAPPGRRPARAAPTYGHLQDRT